MKVFVEIPLRPTREYIDDFDECTIPNVGDRFDAEHIVKEKAVEGNVCILRLKRG